MGGFGSAILELLAGEGLQTPLQVLGAPDELIEHGETPASLGLSPADIQRAVVDLLDRRTASGS